ncbi:MAG: N-acetylneuraminate synthase family protein [Methanomicrobiaceae archaeon]|nr:N-acetylneuraminate synthase family protein [Methanomicrobiaceae archaeon]
MIKTIKIGNKKIGPGEPAFIIADAGSNHDKKLSQAKELIDIAADAGVDAVKFQLFKADTFYSKSDPIYDLFKQCELPPEWIGDLVDHSRDRDIIFLTTPFEKESVDLLCDYKIPALKWASSEIVNLPFLKYAAEKKLPMLLSTGMSDFADIQEAIDIVRSSGNEDIALFQCTSLYPTPSNLVNLKAIDSIREAFCVPTGLSDHTLGISVPVAAVARGASVIEKHFTISRELPGADHCYALEPDALKAMVDGIREVEDSLGSSIKQMLPEEKRLARRNSIIAEKEIPAGTEITAENIVIKRPAHGIKPKYSSVIVGKKANRDIKADEPIDWDMISD